MNTIELEGLINVEVGAEIDPMDLPADMAKAVLGEPLYRILTLMPEIKNPEAICKVVKIDRASKTITLGFALKETE